MLLYKYEELLERLDFGFKGAHSLLSWSFYYQFLKDTYCCYDMTFYFYIQLNFILIIISDYCFSLNMTVANGVIHTPIFGRFSVEKQESLLKITILSIAAVLAFSTRLFSVLR